MGILMGSLVVHRICLCHHRIVGNLVVGEITILPEGRIAGSRKMSWR